MSLAARPPSGRMCFTYCGPENCDCGIEPARYYPSKAAVAYTQPVFNALLERGVACDSEAALAFTEALDKAIQAERERIVKELRNCGWDSAAEFVKND